MKRKFVNRQSARESNSTQYFHYKNVGSVFREMIIRWIPLYDLYEGGLINHQNDRFSKIYNDFGFFKENPISLEEAKRLAPHLF